MLEGPGVTNLSLETPSDSASVRTQIEETRNAQIIVEASSFRKKRGGSISIVMALHPAEYADVWITIKGRGVDGRVALMEQTGLKKAVGDRSNDIFQ